MSHSLIDERSQKLLKPTAHEFAFACPMSFYKADEAQAGKQRRVAGIMSTDRADKQNEIILQDGLNWDSFLKDGWFNSDHKSGVTDVLGFPESVTRFDKGAKLPDGSEAVANCTWVDGYLLDTEQGKAVWELAQALNKTKRRLGFSVEGQIEARTGPNDSIIAKANVRHCAITHQAVNTDSRLEILARSLSAANARLAHSMTITDSSGSAGPVKPGRSYTGQGAGQVHAKENLAGTKKRRRKTQNLTRSEAVHYVKSRVAGASEALARAIVAATHNPLGRGK